MLPEKHDEKREEMTGCTEFQIKAAAGRRRRVEVCIGDFRRSHNFFVARAGCCLSKRRRRKKKKKKKKKKKVHRKPELMYTLGVVSGWRVYWQIESLRLLRVFVAVRGGNKLCRCP